MADELRAGRVRKLLRDLQPDAGAAPTAASAESGSEEAEADELLMPAWMQSPSELAKKRSKDKGKRKKPVEDNEGSDEPANVDAIY